jgi:AcrR family transcriptional regulator
MQPSQRPEEALEVIPRDVRDRVMPAVLDELARWGVERFSIEAMAERHHLDVAMVYGYWGDRQRLIVDAALGDNETLRSMTDTGSLRGDLMALARSVTDHVNTEVGRTYVRALVMDRRGRHDQGVRMMFWQERFNVLNAIVVRAKKRGELRDGVHPVAAVQIVVAPMYVRALYSEDPIEDDYCTAIADLAWHALARR